MVWLAILFISYNLSSIHSFLLFFFYVFVTQNVDCHCNLFVDYYIFSLAFAYLELWKIHVSLIQYKIIDWNESDDKQTYHNRLNFTNIKIIHKKSITFFIRNIVTIRNVIALLSVLLRIIQYKCKRVEQDHFMSNLVK